MSLQDAYKPEDKDLKPVLVLQPEHILPLTIHERRCNPEKDFDPLAHKSKQICIFIEPEEYNHILGDAKTFRMYLDGIIEQYPELFPVMIQQGYTLHDILPESKKMPGIRLRRIKVTTKDGNGNDVFTIRPSFVMPYMVGYTDDVEKPLFLRRWGGSLLGTDACLWARCTVLASHR